MSLTTSNVVSAAYAFHAQIHLGHSVVLAELSFSSSSSFLHNIFTRKNLPKVATALAARLVSQGKGEEEKTAWGWEGVNFMTRDTLELEEGGDGVRVRE